MGRRGAAETGKRMNRWREIRKNGQVRTTSRPLRYSQRGVATIFMARRATLVMCPHKLQANFFRAYCAARTRRRTRCIGQNVGLAVSADVPYFSCRQTVCTGNPPTPSSRRTPSCPFQTTWPSKVRCVYTQRSRYIVAHVVGSTCRPGSPRHTLGELAPGIADWPPLAAYLFPGAR